MEKSGKQFVKFGGNLIQQNSGKICEILEKTAKHSVIFNENFEIREHSKAVHYGFQKRCKGVHCVDLGEGFPTSIYLHSLASIQPRTSLVKFARSPRTDPPGHRAALGDRCRAGLRLLRRERPRRLPRTGRAPRAPRGALTFGHGTEEAPNLSSRSLISFCCHTSQMF